MNLKIVPNPDITIYQEITKAVELNDGFCPCSVNKTKETKCVCKVFRAQTHEGECHCGRYIKIKSQ